jgi:glyoxylase-like metal-dependent hydrolase (beta-lactamase superfamily II)
MAGRLEISKEDVREMENLPTPVRGLRALWVNLYAVEDRGKWVLVDAGPPHSANRIRRWVEETLGPGVRPSCVLLTHGHFDHAGSALDLAEYWDIPIYSHALEKPHLTGREKYPLPDTAAGGGVMPWLAPMFPRGPMDLRARLQQLPADGLVPDLPSWRWIHTPGHTDGHVCFFREQDRTLVSGDAFCTTKQESLLAVARQTPELHGPPAYHTADWEQARESVRLLTDLNPAMVAPGHGLPMKGPHLERALKELAERFDELAVPEHVRARR